MILKNEKKPVKQENNTDFARSVCCDNMTALTTDLVWNFKDIAAVENDQEGRRTITNYEE